MKRKDIEQAIENLPKDCQEPARKAIAICESSGFVKKHCAKAATEDLIEAILRSNQRKTSDRITDGKRRKLVGARVSMPVYEKYSKSAEQQSLSLYQWACNAFEDAAEKIPIIE